MKFLVLVPLLLLVVSLEPVKARETAMTITNEDVARENVSHGKFLLTAGDSLSGEGLWSEEVVPPPKLDPQRFTDNISKAILGVVDEQHREKMLKKRGHGVYKKKTMIAWKFGDTLTIIVRLKDFNNGILGPKDKRHSKPKWAKRP